MEFKLGDKVKWTATSGGCTYAYRGIIVKVIPPNTSIDTLAIMKELTGKTALSYCGFRLPGWERDHESYIVKATRPYHKSGHCYWPKVSGLQLEV